MRGNHDPKKTAGSLCLYCPDNPITANEGDSRDYAGFSEEKRIKDVTLDPIAFSNAATLQMEDNLGRLKITSTLGDPDQDGDFDKLYSFGGRSFSIWKSTVSGLEQVFDSGDQFEQLVAQLRPDLFNVSNDNNGVDDRSDDKGPEPEGVTLGVIDGHTYAFIGLERVGGIMVYDVTDPLHPRFLEYVNDRDPDGNPESGTAGDLGPEGLLFIPAWDSPLGVPLLIVTNEVSGTTTMYEIQTGKSDAVSFAVFTDPHYYDTDLGTTGTAFEAYLAQDRKMIAQSEAITEAAVTALKGDKSLSFALVCGDLTKDGELTSHQEFAAHLSELEQSGIQVFAIPGNHDINNPHAVFYDGDLAIPTDTITPLDFARIYADYGYNQALYKDSESLSYLAEPVSGIYLLALDSCDYDNNISQGSPETGGRFSAATLGWITDMLSMAASLDKKVIAFMHHGLLEHFTGQSMAEPGSEYVISDFENVSTTLADAGLGMVFTGHYHAQDMVSSTDGRLLDVETGSLVTYPSPYRIVTVNPDDESAMIVSRYITAITADTGGQSFPAYSKTYLHDGLVGIATTLLTAPSVYGGYGLDEAMAGVVAPQVADAYMAHYRGDERPDSLTAAIIATYLSSSDPTTFFMGQMLGFLWTDLSPVDTTLRTELR